MHGIPSSYTQGILLCFIHLCKYYYHLLHACTCTCMYMYIVHDFVQFPLRIFLLLGHMRCRSHTPDHKVTMVYYCITRTDCTYIFCDLNIIMLYMYMDVYTYNINMTHTCTIIHFQIEASRMSVEDQLGEVSSHHHFALHLPETSCWRSLT